MSQLLTRPARSPWRWLTAYSLLINAAIHLILTPMHLEEAPYVGVLFVLLSAACLLLAGALALFDTPAVWAATGSVSLLGLLAFLASRTIGLPQLADDVGNWSDPYGWLTIVVETLAVALTVAVLSTHAVCAYLLEGS